MKTLAIIAIVATLGAFMYASVYHTGDNDAEFQAFIAEHGRNYASSEEYNMRREIFYKGLEQIKEHNAKGLSYTLGVNKFADWTDEEYNRLLGLKGSSNQNSRLPTLPRKLNKQADKSIDWRDTEGVVGPIKNQASCGSCWAFSASQAMEAAYFLKYGETVLISESQAVDCDWFSHGCNGGLQENAFIHWMRTGPILEEHYKYEPRDRTCQEKAGDEGTIPADLPELPIAYRVDVGDDLLYEALEIAPVAISIRAENDDFRKYTGGIIDGDGCGTYIDHAVLLVGYNAEQDYWIVKNSWGANWGEDGYVRIKRRGGKGICGINQQNSLPLYKE